MRDFVLTNLEQESNKSDYDEDRLQRNELFCRESIQLLYEMFCLFSNDERKIQIMIGDDVNKFIDKIALNYFLKLKVP